MRLELISKPESVGIEDSIEEIELGLAFIRIRRLEQMSISILNDYVDSFQILQR